MITMKNWSVLVPAKDKTIAYQGDHLTRRLEIETDLDDGWTVFLDLEKLGGKNAIQLLLEDGKLSVDLTRDMLAGDGVYSAQLRGLNGELVKHSNKFALRIADSINAADRFPTMEPSAMAQLERRMVELNGEAARSAEVAQKAAEETVEAAEAAQDAVAELDLKVGSISMEVTQNTGADGQVYASIVLTVGNNQYTGQILMEGNINVSGQLSADALYAALGDIADLTVDRLSTSRRIVKYLAGDTGDDNYITAEDEVLAFVSGVYAGGVEQAVNPNGLPIYWESDPGAASLGTDGYPYLNGVRIFTTTAVTDWPVYVYTYTELTKAKMAFEVVDGYYTPVLTFGAGDGKGGNIGTIQKSVNGMEIRYVTPEQKSIGITMSDDGYVDIDQRRTQSIQINKSAGKVTVLAEGETTAQEITYTETDNSMTFTWPDGHTATVTIS